MEKLERSYFDILNEVSGWGNHQCIVKNGICGWGDDNEEAVLRRKTRKKSAAVITREKEAVANTSAPVVWNTGNELKLKKFRVQRSMATETCSKNNESSQEFTLNGNMPDTKNTRRSTPHSRNLLILKSQNRIRVRGQRRKLIII